MRAEQETKFPEQCMATPPLHVGSMVTTDARIASVYVNRPFNLPQWRPIRVYVKRPFNCTPMAVDSRIRKTAVQLYPNGGQFAHTLKGRSIVPQWRSIRAHVKRGVPMTSIKTQRRSIRLRLPPARTMRHTHPRGCIVRVAGLTEPRKLPALDL